MFKQMDKEIEDKIRTKGTLSIELVTRGIGYDNCNIAYSKKTRNVETIIRRLFTCSICYTHYAMLLWEINRYEGTSINPDEAEQYLLLKILVEESEKWASKSGMNSVSLSSSLPHMSELLIDEGFSLKTVEFIPGIKTHSGMKMLSKTMIREEK